MQAALKGRRANRIHDHVADDFPDRRLDSAAFSCGYRRTVVTGICHHAKRHDSGLCGRVADAHADDVS